MAGPDSNLEALRAEAERILKEDPDRVAALKAKGVDALLHELSVYQIELEMQNDELRTSQGRMEQQATQYFDLYHYAPIAYLTFNEQGVIAEANMAASTLLAIDRERLIGKPLSPYLHTRSQDSFGAHVRDALTKDGKTSCDIWLRNRAGNAFVLRVESIGFEADGHKVVRSMLTDITELKDTEEKQRQIGADLERRVAERTAELLRANELLRQEMAERERAERKLRASEQRYRELVENANSAILRWKRDGTITFFNEYAQHFFGYSSDEAIGRHVGIIVPERESTGGDLASLVDDIVARPEAHVRNINENVRKDGGRVWMAWTNRPLYDEKGDVNEILAIGTDVTDLLHAENKLRESEENWRGLVEAFPECIIVHGEGTIRYVNPAGVRLLGCSSPDEAVGRSIYEIVPEDRLALAKARDRSVEEDGLTTLPSELEFARFDGGTFIGEARGVPIMYGGKRCVQVILRDITGRKGVEDALRRREAFISGILGSISDAFVVVDTDRRCTFANEEFVRRTGKSLPELLGHTIAELFPQLTGTEAHRTLERAMTDREAGQYEVYFDSRQAWYSGRAYPTPDGGLAILSRDITEHKRMEEELRRSHDELEERVRERTAELETVYGEKLRMEEQLRQAHKMEAVGTLAGGIAHDFNNMLAVILGNAELIVDEVGEGPRERIGNIVKASMRSRELVKQILTFSRKNVEQGKAVEVAPLVEETFQLLRASLPSTVQMDLDIRTEADTTVFVQASQVQQIIVNLAHNAAYAMREQQGTLTIGISPVTLGPDSLADDMAPGPYVKLTVKDTGTGIAPDIRKRIFEPFFTTKGPGEGTGMGLAVVYGIVKANKGMIEAESEMGKGSTFTVLLPQSGAPLPVAEEEENLSTSAKYHILVVDDEPAVAETAKAMLQRMGYLVTAFTDADEALTAFIKSPYDFDLVMTDQTMPGITGIDLAKEVLYVREDMPVILCTGYSEWVSSDEAIRAGIREFTMKPITRKELGRAIRRTLGQTKET